MSRSAWTHLTLPYLLTALTLPLGCRKEVPVDPGPSPSSTSSSHPTQGLRAFANQAELERFLESRRKQREPRRRGWFGSKGEEGAATPQAAPAPMAAAESPAKADGAESVTNVQHAGVDEGGIVKVHGEHLVVLRRGRLFTLAIGGDRLAPVASVDAYGPDVDPRGAWYDEMLIANDTIVVIGYSYQRGGTEIGLFDLGRDGSLRYRSTHHLRSNDYYSSRNYASRLLGTKLVFYSPLYLNPYAEAPLTQFPALRRWSKGATPADFKPIYAPTRVYRPLANHDSLALHTVTVCDLAVRELTCEASAVMGPPGRVFYVSPGSVYVWTSHSERRLTRWVNRSFVYRLPLDGSAPTALRVAGSPVDQLSFLESPDQHLNVLVRADGAGDAMWRAEVTQGDVALLRVPLTSFAGDPESAPSERYTALPKPEGHVFQNRYVGDYVLYGTGSGWGAAQRTDHKLVAYRFAGGSQPVEVPLKHGIDRLEALARDAVAVGTDGKDLHFSPISLASTPEAAPSFVLPNASQGELRSHGFFYKPESDRRGLLGLPVRGGGRPGQAHLAQGSASVLFLRNEGLLLTELGQLAAESTGAPQDDCKASCVDWYGNARPLFLQGRVFALLGYELVEGQLTGSGIQERRRVSFAPAAGPLRAR